MVNQTKRKQEKKQPKFKVADMVAAKIDKVDKTSLLHPNMLLGKITSIEESGFVQIVTQYGKINTLISPSRSHINGQVIAIIGVQCTMRFHYCTSWLDKDARNCSASFL